MHMRRVRQHGRLQAPAAAVISGYTRRLLKATDAAVARLTDTNDLDALHDSRVCLRRLRGWMQAFDSHLQLKRRQCRALRRLAQASNPARDAEICIQWLARLRTQLDSRAQAGVNSFLTNLGVLRDKNYRRIRKKLPPTWNRLSRKLLRATFAVRDSGHTKDIFLQTYTASLRNYAADFNAALERARLVPDAVRIHRVRIAAKKLRYLLESILRWYPQVRGLVKELKALHATAGVIQDLQRFQALSEQTFLQQTGARYRRLLVMYADVGADHRTLKHPDLTPALLPSLWISRAACIRQAQYIARFKKAYLSRKRPASTILLRQFMLELAQLFKRTQA